MSMRAPVRVVVVLLCFYVVWATCSHVPTATPSHPLPGVTQVEVPHLPPAVDVAALDRLAHRTVRGLHRVLTSNLQGWVNSVAEDGMFQKHAGVLEQLMRPNLNDAARATEAMKLEREGEPGPMPPTVKLSTVKNVLKQLERDYRDLQAASGHKGGLGSFGRPIFSRGANGTVSLTEIDNPLEGILDFISKIKDMLPSPTMVQDLLRLPACLIEQLMVIYNRVLTENNCDVETLERMGVSLYVGFIPGQDFEISSPADLCIKLGAVQQAASEVINIINSGVDLAQSCMPPDTMAQLKRLKDSAAAGVGERLSTAEREEAALRRGEVGPADSSTSSDGGAGVSVKPPVAKLEENETGGRSGMPAEDAKAASVEAEVVREVEHGATVPTDASTKQLNKQKDKGPFDLIKNYVLKVLAQFENMFQAFTEGLQHCEANYANLKMRTVIDLRPLLGDVTIEDSHALCAFIKGMTIMMTGLGDLISDFPFLDKIPLIADLWKALEENVVSPLISIPNKITEMLPRKEVDEEGNQICSVGEHRMNMSYLERVRVEMHLRIDVTISSMQLPSVDFNVNNAGDICVMVSMIEGFLMGGLDEAQKAAMVVEDAKVDSAPTMKSSEEPAVENLLEVESATDDIHVRVNMVHGEDGPRNLRAEPLVGARGDEDEWKKYLLNLLQGTTADDDEGSASSADKGSSDESGHAESPVDGGSRDDAAQEGSGVTMKDGKPTGEIKVSDTNIVIGIVKDVARVPMNLFGLILKAIERGSRDCEAILFNPVTNEAFNQDLDIGYAIPDIYIPPGQGTVAYPSFLFSRVFSVNVKDVHTVCGFGLSIQHAIHQLITGEEIDDKNNVIQQAASANRELGGTIEETKQSVGAAQGRDGHEMLEAVHASSHGGAMKEEAAPILRQMTDVLKEMEDRLGAQALLEIEEGGDSVENGVEGEGEGEGDEEVGAMDASAAVIAAMQNNIEALRKAIHQRDAPAVDTQLEETTPWMTNQFQHHQWTSGPHNREPSPEELMGAIVLQPDLEEALSHVRDKTRLNFKELLRKMIDAVMKLIPLAKTLEKFTKVPNCFLGIITQTINDVVEMASGDGAVDADGNEVQIGVCKPDLKTELENIGHFKMDASVLFGGMMGFTVPSMHEMCFDLMVIMSAMRKVEELIEKGPEAIENCFPPVPDLKKLTKADELLELSEETLGGGKDKKKEKEKKEKEKKEKEKKEKDDEEGSSGDSGGEGDAKLSKKEKKELKKAEKEAKKLAKETAGAAAGAGDGGDGSESEDTAGKKGDHGEEDDGDDDDDDDGDSGKKAKKEAKKAAKEAKKAAKKMLKQVKKLMKKIQQPALFLADILKTLDGEMEFCQTKLNTGIGLGIELMPILGRMNTHDSHTSCALARSAVTLASDRKIFDRIFNVFTFLKIIPGLPELLNLLGILQEMIGMTKVVFDALPDATEGGHCVMDGRVFTNLEEVALALKFTLKLKVGGVKLPILKITTLTAKDFCFLGMMLEKFVVNAPDIAERVMGFIEGLLSDDNPILKGVAEKIGFNPGGPVGGLLSGVSDITEDVTGVDVIAEAFSPIIEAVKSLNFDLPKMILGEIVSIYADILQGVDSGSADCKYFHELMPALGMDSAAPLAVGFVFPPEPGITIPSTLVDNIYIFPGIKIPAFTIPSINIGPVIQLDAKDSQTLCSVGFAIRYTLELIAKRGFSIASNVVESEEAQHTIASASGILG